MTDGAKSIVINREFAIMSLSGNKTRDSINSLLSAQKRMGSVKWIMKKRTPFLD